MLDNCLSLARFAPLWAGGTQRRFFLSRRISEVTEIRRDRMSYIEVFSPMYDNEDRMYFSENSAVSNESRERRDEWARGNQL